MSKVLIVIPHDRFQDEEFQLITRHLAGAGHQTSIGSSHHTEAQGLFGLLVKPDINVGFVEPRDFDAIVFIGGRGIDEYINNATMMNLVKGFFSERKVIGALGRAVEIMAYAGVLSGRKATCDISTISKVQAAGGYYSGGLVQRDDNLISGTGVEASADFAVALAEALNPKSHRGGLYARTSRS
jgi:protease I